MKKILYFIILLLILLIKVNAKANEITLTTERINDIYTYYYDSNYGQKRFFHMEKYSFEGTYAYCIELGKKVEGNIYSYSTSFDEANISKKNLEYIKLISYYGYDYPGHQTDKYYIATQALIWTKLTNIDIDWTIGIDPNNLLNISNEKNNIYYLIARHNIKPSFDNQTVDIVKGNKVTITDTNGVLADYKVNNNHAHIEGNNLIIDEDIDTDEITVTREGSSNKVFLLYTNGISQKMMSTGEVPPVVSKLKLNILSGSITLHKKDLETGNSPQGEASLKGAIYDLYDKNNKLKGTFITGKNEKIDNLPPGEYYIKEKVPSPGYMLDSTIYTINITNDNLDVDIDVYEDVIKRKVDIFKVHSSSETGLLTPEANILFEVYDKNSNLINKLTTDNNGHISTVLPYGTYLLKQVTCEEGFEKIENYQLEIKEYDSRPIYKIFGNAKIKSKLRVIKKDYYTKEIITNSNAKFKIYDVNNNKYISFTLTYPEQKTIDTFSLTNGTFITPEELPSGKYRLYEVDEKIDGYLYNDEGLEFKINENTDYIYDEEYGKIIELSFYNKPVMGKIELYKYGEDINYTNNTYKYEKKLLDNVVFNLYAKNNIYQNNKLIYQKDELIKELVTDNNGYSSVDNLPLGDYYIKEISSSHDNEIANNIYDINLTYEDQYTEKIIKKIDVHNYLKKGELIINKFDKETNLPLSNTLIEVRTKDNIIVYKGYTNIEGKILIKDLKYGDYYLAEIEASTGYRLLEDSISFTIDKESTIINIYNERVEVPDTSINPIICITISILFFIFGTIILIFSHNNKKINILCIIIIISSCLVITIYHFKSYYDKTKNTKAVEAFLNNKIDNNYDEKYRYEALLEIPSLNIKRGILDIESKYNKAKYNIELIKENENTIVLAAHNGNNYNSYFGKLPNLELGDEIKYYKDGTMYSYIYSDNYEIKKDGYADLYHKNDKKTIILITCKNNTSDAQVVYIGYLKESIPIGNT